MAQYWLDLSQTEAALAAEWTGAVDSTPVVTKTTVDTLDALKFVFSETSGWSSAHWNVVPTWAAATDTGAIEIYARVKIVSGSSIRYIGLGRVQVVDNDARGLFSSVQISGANTHSLFRRGTSVAVDASVTDGPSNTATFYYRAQFDHFSSTNPMKWRGWASGTEPGTWDMESSAAPAIWRRI